MGRRPPGRHLLTSSSSRRDDSRRDEERNLHRGPARHCSAQGSARLLRIRRSWLLFAGNATRQSRGPRADQASQTSDGGRLVTRHLHHHGRRECFASARIGASRTGLQHGNGEILACRAAHAAGIPFTVSTASICSIEDVAAAVGQPFWFQLYVMKDRGFVRSLIERAAAAKCSALVLTVDLQVLGQRHRDIKNGLTVPPEVRLGNLIDIATKPAWAWSVLK